MIKCNFTYKFNFKKEELYIVCKSPSGTSKGFKLNKADAGKYGFVGYDYDNTIWYAATTPSGKYDGIMYIKPVFVMGSNLFNEIHSKLITKIIKSYNENIKKSNVVYNEIDNVKIGCIKSEIELTVYEMRIFAQLTDYIFIYTDNFISKTDFVV